MNRPRLTLRIFLALLLAACGAEDLTPEPELEMPSEEGGGHPAPTAYQVVDGLAVAGGDMLLGNVADAPPSSRSTDKSIHASTGYAFWTWTWRNAIVPYEIGPGFSEADARNIRAAVDHWNQETVYWLRPRRGEADYVYFDSDGSHGCLGSLGKQWGKSPVYLAGDCRSREIIIHEIGHTIGLGHEHNRRDRDRYVDVFLDNVWQQHTHVFDIDWSSESLFEYDVHSIMHYGSRIFSRNGMRTMALKDGSDLPYNTNLSQTDVAGATRLLHRGKHAFKVVISSSGKCLDVPGGSLSNEERIVQWDCHGADNQRWTPVSPGWGSGFMLVNQGSGKCLDLPYANYQNGTGVQQYNCHGQDNQRFYRYQGTIRNIQTGKCLDITNSGGENGAQLIQYDCHGGSNQQLSLVW